VEAHTASYSKDVKRDFSVRPDAIRGQKVQRVHKKGMLSGERKRKGIGKGDRMSHG